MQQPHCGADDGVENRLHVGRGLADDTKDFGGRGLPLQRFPGLVDQAGILDGNGCLVGEALQQRQLFRREG